MTWKKWQKQTKTRDKVEKQLSAQSSWLFQAETEQSRVYSETGQINRKPPAPFWRSIESDRNLKKASVSLCALGCFHQRAEHSDSCLRALKQKPSSDTRRREQRTSAVWSGGAVCYCDDDIHLFQHIAKKKKTWEREVQAATKKQGGRAFSIQTPCTETELTAEIQVHRKTPLKISLLHKSKCNGAYFDI